MSARDVIRAAWRRATYRNEWTYGGPRPVRPPTTARIRADTFSPREVLALAAARAVAQLSEREAAAILRRAGWGRAWPTV